MEKLLFTSESVTEGHPDKICDQISDAVLDALLAQDPMSRVACETAVTTGLVLVMGEITTKAQIDMYVNEAEIVSGIPSSYPGYDLTIGSSGEPVITIQEQLNRIAQNYPAIPTVTVDGIFGSATTESVRAFQSIFNLPVSGIVDFPTWYKISQIYVGVSKIGENIR